MSSILLPVVSEKAVSLADSEGVYLFVVPQGATKIDVKRAVAERFKVKVVAVNTANVKGKPKSGLVKRGSRRIKGERSDVKRAYVKLAKGESIKLFEEGKK